jgi:hypothetical protein
MESDSYNLSSTVSLEEYEVTGKIKTFKSRNAYSFLKLSAKEYDIDIEIDHHTVGFLRETIYFTAHGSHYNLTQWWEGCIRPAFNK